MEQSRILIVEDSVPLQDVLKSALGSYETVTASCVAEAETELEGQSYCCALIDLGLPDGNGLDLLPRFRAKNPWGIPIILTGDVRPETIVETMRAGAYDYLMKPLDLLSLRNSVERAIQHHRALRERDNLFHLLEEERKQLQVRVEQATADIRQYAKHCEVVNARLDALLRLTQTCAEYYTDEWLFRRVLEEISRFLPVSAAALLAPQSEEFLAAVKGPEEEIRIISSTCAQDIRSDRTSPGALLECLEQYADVNTDSAQSLVFPQTFMGRMFCNVGFLIAPKFEVDDSCYEFLGMCAHFLASEWQEAQLLLYAAQHAALGNMAVEVSNQFIQSLTAMQTAGEAVSEMGVADDVHQGIDIILGNVEKIRRQLEEFRHLTQPPKGSFMTVDLTDYLNQAVEMLGPSIENRRIRLVKEFSTDGRCIVLNISTLSWTVMNLVANAARAVDTGEQVTLRLIDHSPDAIEFDVLYRETAPDSGTPEAERPVKFDPQTHPTFFLAQRTIRNSGGKLVVDRGKDGLWMVRVILPRDPMKSPPPETV